MRRRLGITIAVLFVIAVAADAFELDLERARIDRGTVVDGPHRLTYDGQGHAGPPRTELSSTLVCGGRKSLVYEIPPSPEGEVPRKTDKAMHWLDDRGTGLFAFGQRRYVAFTIRIPSDSFGADRPGTKGPIVWQLWQGAPFGPAVAARVTTTRDDRTATMTFTIKNDATTPYPSAPPLVAGSILLAKDHCTRLAIMVEPHAADSPTGKQGHLVVWRYDAAAGRFQRALAWSGPIGYDPGNPKGFYRDRPGLKRPARPNRRFKMSIGLYRNRQATHHKMVFDDIVFARRLEGLD